MDALRIAARVAAGLSQPLSDRPDYGSREMVSQEEQDEESLPSSNLGQQEQEGVVRKTPGKGYCVKSEKNPDWSGGCAPTKGEAEKRLKQVEYFKHKGSAALIAATDAFLASPSEETLRSAMLAVKFAGSVLDGDELALIAVKIATPMDEANAGASKTVAQGPSAPKAFIHMNIDPEDSGYDPDGKYAAAFSHAVAQLGGTIENWEGEWLEIIVPQDKLQGMLGALGEIAAGKHGPDAQKTAELYSVTEVYGDDGEGNPGDVIQTQ